VSFDLETFAALGLAATLLAALAWWGDRRRLRRENLDAVGWVPWTPVFFVALLVAIVALGPGGSGVGERMTPKGWEADIRCAKHGAAGGRQMAKTSLWAAAAAVALAGCATAGTTSAAGPGCDGSAEANRRIVLAFYNEGLVGRQPQSAFMRFMAPDSSSISPMFRAAHGKPPPRFSPRSSPTFPKPDGRSSAPLPRATWCSCTPASPRRPERPLMPWPTSSG
jgi:hypothetical protein